MNPTQREINFSRVLCLLDELEGKPLNREYWGGYHPKVYGKDLSTTKLDIAVRQLCEVLRKTDVTNFSLELQTWWRDHQRADKDRLLLEKNEKKIAALRKAALKKLTKAEREALRLE